MKFLNKILSLVNKLFTILQKTDLVNKGIIVGLIVLFLYFSKDCSGKELDTLKAQVEQTKKQTQQLNDSLETLQVQVVERENAITQLKSDVSVKEKVKVKLVYKQQDLESRRQVETDTVTIIALQDSTIDNLKTQVAVADTIINTKDKIIGERETQISLLQTSVGVANTKADLLQTQLDNVMNSYKKETKVFGFIPKPTRKAAFIGGVAIGLITGIVIAK